MRTVAIFAATNLLIGCSGGGSSDPAPVVQTPPPPPPPPVSTVNTDSEAGIVYGTGLLQGGSANLLLDIYQPDGECVSPRPFVIGIHGGGFIGGSRDSDSWVTNMEGVTERGFVGLSIDYRLTGDNPVVSAEFQPILDDFLTLADDLGLGQAQRDQLNAATAAMEDTVSAIEWAVDNADDRCLDIDQYAIWGSSAGAITGLHVAHGLDEYFINRPDPLVAIDYWGRLLVDNLVDADGPPFMIIHGTADNSQIYEETALVLAAEADSVGLPYAFYTIQGGPHGFSSVNPDRVQINGTTALSVTLDFIEAHLENGDPLYEVETIVPTDG